ncbi:hypothetical protein FISHEDRAFT_34879 [Fistulina hepatica ATCC 64428]|uniref:Uncharacterized protein n=1 Tax=Fistulina hepatica ATCC 64428 TaxID=1128425 RepID=A0A0D7AMV2_9AGAR|nr:hypothetical protein FISHEDRAFT_34879 [Fistulina hepatica ATCC 64428]
MSDPRFARLKSDPRFRKLRKKETKVVVDERFKSVFQKKKTAKQVDKYGRHVPEAQENDDLRRFYRLEDEDEDGAGPSAIPDYARGEVLMESSDEGDDADDSEDGGYVALGGDQMRPITVGDDDNAEIDLNEDGYADLDDQAVAYSKSHPETEVLEGERTRRLAVVNLDWDHVRAIHLFKIFSSLVSPTAAPRSEIPSGKPTQGGHNVAKGRVLSVHIYPSSFGKERMAREEREGPPPELFKKRNDDQEDVDETNVYDVGGEEEYNEDVLRKYQLKRLRYYYAIVTCDTVDAASHIYAELDGTELERSANVIDLSFVLDDMTFDEEPRDEASEVSDASYKAVDFVTDALRHSRVKLTWDEDDAERSHTVRRALTRKDIEDEDYGAYLAPPSSEEEDSDDELSIELSKKDKKAASRAKLRALLTGGDSEMPEGWGDRGAPQGEDGEVDVDMQITFTPGLSVARAGEDETTLDKYQRKVREKRKRKKEERTQKKTDERPRGKEDAEADDFFEIGGDDESNSVKSRVSKKNGKHRVKEGEARPERPERTVSTAEELALLVAPDDLAHQPEHFDMKAVLKAEKKARRKGKDKKAKKTANGEAPEIQKGFELDVNDARFSALFEDHSFAIDPTNPHFKKTKGMTALLDERARRQREELRDDAAVESNGRQASKKADGQNERNLQSLVESVKRKSVAYDGSDSEPQAKKRKKIVT